MSIIAASLQPFYRSETGSNICVEQAHFFSRDDEAFSQLFETLKLNYLKRAQKQFGHFQQISDNFSDNCQQYQQKQLDFPTFQQQFIQQLQQHFSETEDLLDYHILCAHEQLEADENLYLLFVQQKEVTCLDSLLNVLTQSCIDLSKISFGLKLDLQAFAADENNYLSKASRGNRFFSQAFLDFTGFMEGLDLKAQTQEFLDIVDRFSQQLPDEQEQECKSSIVDFCIDKDSQGEAVVIEELAKQLDDQQAKEFSQFVKQNQSEPSEQLQPHRASLKRYVRFFGRDQQMSISFDSNRFGHDIQFDEQANSLTINEIPSSLLKQIQDYLKKQE